MLPSATSDPKRKKEKMSWTTSKQTTMDGKPAPAPVFTKELPYHQRGGHQMNMKQASKEARAILQREPYPGRGHRTPCQELAWQERNREKGEDFDIRRDPKPQQTMSNLLEWHATCPGSFAFPPPSQDPDEHFDDPDYPPPEPEDDLFKRRKVDTEL